MTILDEIFTNKKLEVESLKRAQPPGSLRREAEAAPVPIDFVEALRARANTSPALIAEVKKASPSKGVLREDFDPVRLARVYLENGAAAISVLTDSRYFQGSLDDLKLVHAHYPAAPLLRKDFSLDPYQLYEARLAGASAVLLIAAWLETGLLHDLHNLALELGLTPLVEIHTREELETVLKIKPVLLGINNRDLHTFTVDLETTLRIRPHVPAEVCLVSESGIHTPGDVTRLAAAQVDAILVGEALLTAHDIAQKVRSLARLAPESDVV